MSHQEKGKTQKLGQKYCSVDLLVLTILGLIMLLLVLTFGAFPPQCFIQSLHVPSLHHHNKNDTLVFQLLFQNDNIDKGIKYDPVHVTFRIFLDDTTTWPFANATLDAFYQGRGKTAHQWGSAVVNRTVDTVNGRVFLRVEFTTRLKYKTVFGNYVNALNGRRRFYGAETVEVNVSSGEMVEPNGIRLDDELLPRLKFEAVEVRD